MPEREIDCRGLKCPEPVMRTRKALAEAGQGFTVLVDNEAARDNVSRFARTAGCGVSVSEIDGGFAIEIEPGAGQAEETAPATAARCGPGHGSVVLVTADEMGKGDRELGATLMKSFLYASSEGDDVPTMMVFMNSGVRLVTVNEETAEHVRKLEERGVDVLVCGTCLDYYGLKERLAAGRVSNMYEIQSVLIGSDNLVTL